MRRRPFEAPAAPEAKYAVQLRKIAKHVAEIIAAFPIGDPAQLPAMQRALNGYAEAILPWALKTATDMHEEVWMSQRKNWQTALPKKDTVAAYKDRNDGNNSRHTRDKAHVSKLDKSSHKNTSGR